MKFIYITLFSWVFMNLAQAQPYADFSHPIIVKSGAPLVVLQLPATPSTGYQWVLTHYDPNLLIPKGQEYHPPEPSVPGKSGYILLKFEMKPNAFIMPQQTLIDLQYLRPWEDVAAKTFSIRLISETE